MFRTRANSKAFSVEYGRDEEGREGNKGEGNKNIEVQCQVKDVEIPRRCPIQLRSALRAAEDVIMNDVPRNYGEVTISESIDTNHRNLHNHYEAQPVRE